MAKVVTTAVQEAAFALQIPTSFFRLLSIQLLSALSGASKTGAKASSLVTFVYGAQEVKLSIREAKALLPTAEYLVNLPSKIIANDLEGLPCALNAVRGKCSTDLENFLPFAEELAVWSRGNRALCYLADRPTISAATAEQVNGTLLEYMLPEQHFLLRHEGEGVVRTDTGVVLVDTMLVTSEASGIRVRPLPRILEVGSPPPNESRFKTLIKGARKGGMVPNGQELLDWLHQACGTLRPDVSLLIEGDWIHARKLRHIRGKHRIVPARENSWLDGMEKSRSGRDAHLRNLAVQVLVILDNLITKRPTRESLSQGTSGKPPRTRSKHERITDPDAFYHLGGHRVNERVIPTGPRADGQTGKWRQPPHVRWVGERLRWGHRKLPEEERERIFIGYVEVNMDESSPKGLHPGFVKKTKPTK